MKLNILQIIYFCLINCAFTFPNDLFDELWEPFKTEPQPNTNPIKSQPKIKVEPYEEQFGGGWQDESALKGNVKVEHGPHFGAVKVEGTVKIKHESAYNLDQENSKKELSDQNESVDEQQNKSNECDKNENGYSLQRELDQIAQPKVYSDQQKREIIQKFRDMKEDHKKKRKYSTNDWAKIDTKISNGLGVNRTKVYKWIKELGLRKETKLKLKFSELQKREILKQFDQIKSKCKKAKLKNISMRELDKKIAIKLSVSRGTIIRWKRKFGLSLSNKKISDATKIEILKKYAKIKGNNPKMTNAVIAGILNISLRSLCSWKKQFKEEIKNLKK